MHQAGCVARHPGLAEAPLVERAELVVLDQHVGPRDQPAQDLACLRLAEIEPEAALVAVDAEIVCRLAADMRWSPGAGIVAIRRLDLDDLRAHVAERHRAQRAGQHPREIEHLDAVERACHLLLRPEFRPLGECERLLASRALQPGTSPWTLDLVRSIEGFQRAPPFGGVKGQSPLSFVPRGQYLNASSPPCGRPPSPRVRPLSPGRCSPRTARPACRSSRRRARTDR